jgi:hypothetical protein
MKTKLVSPLVLRLAHEFRLFRICITLGRGVDLLLAPPVLCMVLRVFLFKACPYLLSFGAQLTC